MPEVKQDLGLTVLTSSAVFGAWSAWNSSLFTAATFVDDAEKLKHAILAMNLGLATAVATGIGVYWVYGEKGKVAAVAAVATGAVLYAAYYCKLRANPKLNGAFGITKKLSNDNEWQPLSSEQINDIKNITSNNPFRFVAEP